MPPASCGGGILTCSALIAASAAWRCSISSRSFFSSASRALDAAVPWWARRSNIEVEGMMDGWMDGTLCL